VQGEVIAKSLCPGSVNEKAGARADHVLLMIDSDAINGLSTNIPNWNISFQPKPPNDGPHFHRFIYIPAFRTEIDGRYRVPVGFVEFEQLLAVAGDDVTF
jgi:hypothetical protein